MCTEQPGVPEYAAPLLHRRRYSDPVPVGSMLLPDEAEDRAGWLYWEWSFGGGARITWTADRQRVRLSPALFDAATVHAEPDTSPLAELAELGAGRLFRVSALDLDFDAEAHGLTRTAPAQILVAAEDALDAAARAVTCGALPGWPGHDADRSISRSLTYGQMTQTQAAMILLHVGTERPERIPH